MHNMQQLCPWTMSGPEYQHGRESEWSLPIFISSSGKSRAQCLSPQGLQKWDLFRWEIDPPALLTQTPQDLKECSRPIQLMCCMLHTLCNKEATMWRESFNLGSSHSKFLSLQPRILNKGRHCCTSSTGAITYMEHQVIWDWMTAYD